MGRTLRAAIRTIVLIPLFFFYTLSQAAYVIWIGKRNRDSPKIEQTIQRWAGHFMKIPPIVMTVEGAGHVDPDRRYVVVANHTSNFDIPVLFRAIPTPIRFLAKKELYKIPILGPGMDTAGIVKVDRGGAISTRQAINDAA
ncbi:MAG: lysophospholipid acyltransferase family protein, partial [Acidimicrobiia bacterium]